MTPGMPIILWSVRAAFALYIIALAAWIRQKPRPARAAWTAGFFCYLCHMIAAFAFHHGWSHDAAYRETARQTAELFGVNSGGGLYFNYVFTAVWGADVLWSWTDAKRPRWVAIAIHTFLAFMWINATIVFVSGPIRWIGAASAVGLGALWLAGRRR